METMTSQFNSVYRIQLIDFLKTEKYSFIVLDGETLVSRDCLSMSERRTFFLSFSLRLPVFSGEYTAL